MANLLGGFEIEDDVQTPGAAGTFGGFEIEDEFAGEESAREAEGDEAREERIEPVDNATLMERLASGDLDDEIKTRAEKNSLVKVEGSGIGAGAYYSKRNYDDNAKMNDLAEIARDAGLSDWQVKRIRSESKTPEEMRDVLKFVAGNRSKQEGVEKESALWKSVPRTILNTAGKMVAGSINLVGTMVGGIDEDARRSYMADDPMAKKEGESFEDWLGRVHIDEKVKRMAKSNPAVRENLERYYKWEAPIAGKEGMHQEHSIVAQNGREGTDAGNFMIRSAKRLGNWLDEKVPAGNSGNAVVDWLEGAASGIAQFAYLGPMMIATSAADSYQRVRSTALESGRSGAEAEALAIGNALFDGGATAAFYYAPVRRWMNGKGIVPVQPVEKFTFSGLSKAMGRFNAKREFLNQGVAALEAGGIMSVQGAGDTAFRQLANGEDLDLGEITLEGAKSGLDGIAIGAIMGAGRILNARIRGERDYEKVVREAAKTPEGRFMLARMNPDGMMDLKRFIQEGVDVVKAHEKPAADFETDIAGRAGKGRAPAPDWKPTKETLKKFRELCDKAGLPPDAKLAAKIVFDPNVANFLGDTLNSRFTQAARTRSGRAAIPESPVIDAQTGEVVEPSKAIAQKIRNEFGQEPVAFTLPQTADGKPSLTPMKWRDNRTGKENTSNIAHDPQTGVTIMEEADGTFSVHNDTGDSDGAETIAEAIEKAKELALMGQYTVLERERKKAVIENERAAKYGKKNVAYFNTMTEAAEAIENGIARSGGRFLGLESADQLRDPSVQDRDAFYTPDGTTVVILDNVHEVGDISRILAHEIVGHGGPNGEFGGKRGAQVEFAENIRAKQFEEFKKQIVDGNLDYVKASSMDAVNRNLGEVFAHYASANLEQEPSALNKLISKVNDAARKAGMRKTYSASDVKTMLARWREAVKGAGGDTIDLTDASSRFDFFPAEAPESVVEAPGAHGEAEAVAETAKPPEASEGDSSASGALSAEPRRMTSTEEVISSAKTPFSEAEKAALEGAADVSGVDATDEAPQAVDYLGVLSRDAPIVRLDPAKVDRSDAILPNMKKDANRKSGIVKPLSGEWHPTMGGIGAVWLTKDGKLVVITGRHRSELAERKGKSMLYYLYREADGFTKEDALIYDAVANIHDEKGTINDYLAFFDRINPTREQAEKAGILSGKGLVAWSIYKDAAEAVRSATALDGNPGEGQISPQQAAIIAQAAPKDANERNGAIQKQLLKAALGGLRGKVFEMYARLRAAELGKAKINKNLLAGEQMSLFDSEEDLAADALAQRQAQYRTKKANAYKEVVRNLRAALNGQGKLELNKEYAKELGVTKKTDGKQLEAALEKAGQLAYYWENAIGLEESDLAAMNAQINAEADAKAKKLAEAEAKREAAKSGKSAPKPAEPVKKPEPPPAPEPSKNAPASAPQKEGITTPPKPEKPVEGKETANSTVLSGDEVRKTMPGYDRLDWSTHVDRSGYVGPRLEAQFQRLLKERKGKGNGTVVFLAGGNGAGKSTSVAAEKLRNADFVIDSTLGNLEAAKKQIDAILANGQTPIIHFVYRSPGQALEGIAQRVKNGGHIVSPLSFANSHVKSRENLRLISEAYCDKIHVHIYDNSVEGAPEITLEQLEAKGKPDHARLREEANYYLGHLRDRERAVRVNSGGVAGSGAESERREAQGKSGKDSGGTGGRNGQGNSSSIAGSGAEGERREAHGGKGTQKGGGTGDVASPSAQEAPQTSQVAAPRQPSIKMKDAAAEKLAQKQEDELAALFDTPELSAENENPAVNGALDHHSENAPRARSASQNAAVALNRKPAVAKRTGEIVAYSAAKVKRHIREYRNGDMKVAVNTVPDMLRGLGKLFGMKYRGRSRYVTYEVKLDNITLRLSDHNASGTNFSKDPAGKYVSVYVEGITYPHRSTPIAYTEIRFPKESYMRNARGVANAIIDGVESLLDTGDFKVDPKIAQKIEYPAEISFDTSEFDVDVFQKRVGAVANLVKTYKESGVADFKTLATRMAERFPEKFATMKPYLRGVWNAVADQMNLADVSRSQADEIFGIIETQAKEAENGRELRSGGSSRVDSDEGTGRGGDNGLRPDAGVSAAGGGATDAGRVLASGRVRSENPDRRVDGGRPGVVPRQPEGRADSGNAEVLQGRGGSGRETSAGNGSVADSIRLERSERETGRDRAGDGDNPKLQVKKAAKKAADSTKPNPSRRDFVMTKAVEEAILEKKTANRVRNNLDAIKLIRELKARDYAATPEEQAALAKFVGWGGLREAVFGYDLERAYDLERSGEPDRAATLLRREGISQSAYDLHKELRQVLNDKEYESAKESASTAFYTPIEFVRILHDELRRLGVKGGRFLGPSAGTGNFASAAGAYEKPVNWQFVEKDAMTGEMLKALFPNQRVNIGGFEDTKFPDGFFDFAIDNVPYADVPINDRSLSSKMFKIHDYFFAKTLAKLRPGGVMAFLTSTGTLDKTSPILRQFLTEHGGRIVGAVRLPNGFFSENAGTDVASDLVIVQKVQGKPDNSAFERQENYTTERGDFNRKTHKYDQKPIGYNGYFKDHPEQVVGEMTVESGRFGPTLQFKMPEGDMWEQVRAAVQNAFAGIDHDALLKEAAVAQKQDHTPIYDDEGLRQGNVTMKDGKPFIKSGEMLEPIEFPKDRGMKKELAKRMRTPKQIMDGLMSLRKAMRDVIDAQMSDSDVMETDLAPLQAKLNETYDAFVKKNGSLHDKWISPFVMLDKADGNRLLALERTVKGKDGEKDRIEKTDIFSKRVISRGQRATRAETPKDALVICYSETGAINVPRIAELLGVDADEAVAKLKEDGDVFENPQTGLLEPSWGYLSGRVRAKLAAARAAVEAGEESYRANVEALEKVQPSMVKLEDTEIKFGATWVDPECMADFLRDAFGSEHMRISLSKNEVTGQWNVEFGHIMNEDPWGETSWPVQEFVSRVLNHGSMNHFVTDPVDKKRYLDERRTEANKLAAEKLHSAFSQFIQSSEKWATPMYERYNAVMTDMVEIQLPNNILPFRSAGMSEATLGKLFEGGDPNRPKKGREYQSEVIARGVLGNGSLCLAHCVGAGKTLEMQSIGVLGRHLGLFKKPMYVVPNHTLEQFTNAFVEAFPNANILKMSEDDVKPENRRAFFAQVANGDWDAIVVKHSTFSKKLAMSEEYQKEFIEAQRRDLIEAIAAMREAGEKISVDQATKKLERLEAKLEQLANAENHDSQIVPFEELGVDQLFVDEAHNFKGMPITTRQGRTGGLSQGDSQRAVDMQMKAQYVQSLHGGDRGVVFATGTPLSNAPVVEAFVMLKYLAPNKLEEQGLKHFDDFVDAFGRITRESIFSEDGKSVKEKDMISGFVNIPELMKLFRSVVDIVNQDQLDIPRPKPKYHMIDVDMTEAQKTVMESVAREAGIPASKEWRNKYMDLTWVAKYACITPKMLGIDELGNKVLRVVSEVKRVYDETSDNRGAQLIFTDRFEVGYEEAARRVLGDKADIVGRISFNLNKEIKDLLVQSGIPADEIAIIHDIEKAKGDKDTNKEALFAKVRSGEVRVLIGSRPRMGEGTNVQERLAAIHLLHPGWKPAEDEQAIGRIIRFGNTYKEGQIFYYLTSGNDNIGSYETKNHQLIGVKSKLIDQVMHGDETIREIDTDESAINRDMLMGLASGNKALMELIDVKKRVHKLELNTESTMNSARRNKDKAEANSHTLQRRREEFAKEQEGVKEWREKNEGKPFTLSTPDGRSIEKVKDMAEYVSGKMAKLLTQDRYDRSERTILGDFNGVELVLAYDRWGDEKFRIAVPLLGVAREINYSGFIPDFSQGAMTAFKGKIFETVSPDFAKAYENSLADMDRQAKKMSADADRFQKDYETMRGELIKLRTRQAELERAVTPLIVQTIEDRSIAAYGNWAITKAGAGYTAVRERDGKPLNAPTVKELIPLMDAEDFASPNMAATKTMDIRPEPDAKGEVPRVDRLPVGEVDFDTPELAGAYRERLVFVPVDEQTAKGTIRKWRDERKDFVNHRSGRHAELKADWGKIFSETAKKESADYAAHYAAANKLDVLFEDAVKMWDEPPRNGSADISEYAKYGCPFVVGNTPYLAKITVKEYADTSIKDGFYSIEAISVEKISAGGINAGITSVEGHELDPDAIRAIGNMLQATSDIISQLGAGRKGVDVNTPELGPVNVADFDKANGTELASVVALAQAMRANDERTVAGFRGRHFRFAKTNTTLKDAGLSGDYFTIRAGVILRHNGKDAAHDITPEEWGDIADALTNKKPQAIEKRGEGSFRIWTQATIGGRIAVVGADVKNAGRDIDVNSIATVFGAEGISIKEDNLVYPETQEEKRSVLTRLNSGRYTASLQDGNIISQSRAGRKGVDFNTPELAPLTGGDENGKLLTVNHERLTSVIRGLAAGDIKHPRFTKEEVAASKGIEHEQLWHYILSLENADNDARRAGEGASRLGADAAQDGGWQGRLGSVATRYARDPREIIEESFKFFDRGAESRIYLSDNPGKVLKVREFAPYNTDGAGEALARIVYHNYLFPKDAYTLRDIAVWDDNGHDRFFLILEQPLVVPKMDANGYVVKPTDEQIARALAATGQRFSRTGGYSDVDFDDSGDDSSSGPVESAKMIAYNGEYAVYDFKPGANTFIDAATGEVRFIDPRVNINDPGMGMPYSKYGKRKKKSGQPFRVSPPERTGGAGSRVDFDTPELSALSADMSNEKNAKAFKTWLKERPQAPSPEWLSDGSPKTVFEWFEKNMVGKTFAFDIPGYGHREFKVAPGHIGKLVCEGAGKGIITKPLSRGWMDAVRNGEIETKDVRGWDVKRARMLPRIPILLDSFDAVVHEFDKKHNVDVFVFVKRFDTKNGRPNTIVMKLIDDGKTIGPVSTHVRDMTLSWLKNKDLILTEGGEVYSRSADNSASRQPLVGDNAEGNSQTSADIISQSAAESKGVSAAEDAAYMDAVNWTNRFLIPQTKGNAVKPQKILSKMQKKMEKKRGYPLSYDETRDAISLGNGMTLGTAREILTLHAMSQLPIGSYNFDAVADQIEEIFGFKPFFDEISKGAVTLHDRFGDRYYTTTTLGLNEFNVLDAAQREDIFFDTPKLTAAEEKYVASEDKAPTEDVMREVYGMTNEDIATAMKAAGMEPPKHVRKPDATAWQQAEALLSNPSYMAKLSRAVARFPRNIADYENDALNILFRQRQNAVNVAQGVVDRLKETLDTLDAMPKEERDADFNEAQKKTAKDYAQAKAKLAQAKALMFETGTALTRSSSEAGRRLRSNRGLVDQTDYSYAGISGQIAAIVGGVDKITPEMDGKIREIAGSFASLDEAGRDLATARLKAHAEKIVAQIKNGDKMRKAAERKPGDEARRVMRNYNDAIAQIEVGAAEVGGTLVGLSDQQYPAWGKWLRAIGEFHCFENPDITEEECIKAIVEDISPFMDGVDENQVRDALTGFGHNFRQSRYKAQRLMNDLRSQTRLKRQLDWMDETNTMPPLTGLVRDEPSDTTRSLQKQVQERKKEVPDAGRDERRLKGVLESVKTRVRNRIADLERAIATGEKIPGRERSVLEDIELRGMKKRRDELQKEYDELFKTEKGLTEAERVKLAERMLGRELEHALEDLDRARSGDFSKRPKRPGVESPTLDVLRARLAEIRGQIHDLKLAKYEFGMTPEELDAFNARKMANRERVVARLAERIVRGDLRPQKKPQPPMTPEMQKRYDELAEQMSRAHRKLADLRREAADARKPAFVRFLGDAYRFVDGVWKMATASLDFTQVGNQTGAILMAHPKIVAENFAKTLPAFRSTANAEAIELDLLSEPSVKEAVDNGWLRWKKVSDSTNRGDRVELFDALDKPFTIGGKALRLTDIPYYGTAIANSDRLYATYINAASASLYSTIVNDPKLFPGGASVFQKKMLCDMINVMNGSGSLSNDNRRMLGKVFWAPGLVDSQLKRLVGYQIWHPWTASAEEDGSGSFAERLKMSRIGLGEFVRSNLGAILLGSLLMALFSTDDQKDEFAHAGAVRKLQMLVAPRIRHTQLDFTGGSVAFLRLGSRLVSGAYETATGKQVKVRDTFGEVAHFAKGRLTPLISNLFSALSGKDYTGQAYGAAELLLSFAPISLRDAGKSIYENGIEDREWGTAFLGAGLTMFGIGKGTYRKDDYKILTNRFLESKKEYDAIENDELLDEVNRRELLDNIRTSNPLMRDEVREDIAADITQIRKDEARARKDEKEGYEADAALLSDIERGKAAVLEKIRRLRR